MVGVVDAVVLIPGKAGIDNAHELADHIDDHFFVRMGEWIHTVDAAAVAIVLQNGIDDLLRLLFHSGHVCFLLISLPAAGYPPPVR